MHFNLLVFCTIMHLASKKSTANYCIIEEKAQIFVLFAKFLYICARYSPCSVKNSETK